MANGTIRKIGLGTWQTVVLPHTLAKDGVVRISLNPYNANPAYILISDGTAQGLRLNAFSGYAEIKDFVCKQGATLTITASANGDATVYINDLD